MWNSSETNEFVRDRDNAEMNREKLKMDQGPIIFFEDRGV